MKPGEFADLWAKAQCLGLFAAALLSFIAWLIK
jgi:hypothetical protein